MARCERHVDLTFVRDEPATPHHHPDRAAGRVERHDGRVEALKGVRQRRAGLLAHRLQGRVEGRMDPQPSAEQLVLALLVGGAEYIALVQQVVA